MAISDEVRINASPIGGRDAFEVMVRRYQGFVASIAYSATGDLLLSEDIAQQVFVTAWQRQGSLRDAGRVAGWLAGITRNLLRRDIRVRQREAAARANLALAAPTPQVTPAEQAIKQEEQRLLWSILEQVSANYREPLILYYREEHSVADVARLMGLSEEAVKQRLARGRKMIRDDVARFVEDTLTSTRPGSRFTATVLAALPAADKAASGAANAAVAKTISAMKAGAIGSIIGSLQGLVCVGFALWAGLRLASSRAERRNLWLATLAVLTVSTVQLGTMAMLLTWYPWVWRSPWFLVPFWLVYLAWLFGLPIFFCRRHWKIKLQCGTPQEKHDLAGWDSLPPADFFLWEWAPQRARREVAIGLSIFMALGAIAGFLVQRWVEAIGLCCLFPIVATAIFGIRISFRWQVFVIVAATSLFFVSMALMLQDWTAAGCLAVVGVLSAAVFWRVGGACRNRRAALKLWILIQWYLALVVAVATVLRRDFWVARLMPLVPADWAPFSAWVTAGSILALCLLITLIQWLSAPGASRNSESERETGCPG